MVIYVISLLVLAGFLMGNLFFFDHPAGFAAALALVAYSVVVIFIPREKTRLNEDAERILHLAAYALLFIGALDAIIIAVTIFP